MWLSVISSLILADLLWMDRILSVAMRRLDSLSICDDGCWIGNTFGPLDASHGAEAAGRAISDGEACRVGEDDCGDEDCWPSA